MQEHIIGKEIESRYVVISKLGGGGMGSVYLAKDMQRNGKEVALKLIRQELCGDAKMRRRFVKEAQAFHYLNHPNIVQVERFGQTADGQLYMVMEYIRSCSMQSMRDVILPFRLIIDLSKQLLDALAHSHIRGIIHRDLKPANILLCPLSNKTIFLKLVDFGIASLPQFAQSGEEFTRTVLGTPYYMAPEQSRGKALQIGPGTDLYSVGVLLFELLAGKLPYKGAVDIETILMHNDEPIPELRARREINAPKEIGEIVRKCLAKRTWDRYVSANELSKTLLELKYDKNESYEHVWDLLKTRIEEDERKRGEEGGDVALSRGSLSRPITLSGQSAELPSRDFSEKMISNAFSNKQETSAMDSGSGSGPSFASFEIDSDSQPSLRARFAQAGNIVGRTLEIGQIQELCLNAIESRGNMVLIEGEWGLGKTTMLQAGVQNYLDANIVRFVSTMFNKNETSTSLTNVYELLLDSKNVESNSLTEYLLFNYSQLRFTHQSDADSFVSFLRPSRDEELKPDKTIYQAMIDVLAAVCADMPCVVALDDIHFANAFELGFIEAFAAACHTRPIRCLLICSVNPKECFPNTASANTLRRLTRFEGSRLKTIRLMPLALTFVRKLLEQFYRVEQSATVLFAQLSRGNPLVLREIIYLFLEERRMAREPDGTYYIVEGRGPTMSIPPLVKEIYISYFKRVKNYLEKDFDPKLVDDIVTRLAILGEVVEDELLEEFFETEDKREYIDALDDVIEALIGIDFLRELSTKQGKTALAFENSYFTMAIIGEHSLRRMRSLHKLAIDVKLKYFRSMDIETISGVLAHFEAIGAASEAQLMRYKLFNKASDESMQYALIYHGMILYKEFDDIFMKISSDADKRTAEDLFSPINWPDVLDTLGRTIFYMGKDMEAEQIVDKLIYCAQRYNAPILIAKAQSLMALFLMTRTEFEASLQQLDESSNIAAGYENGIEIIANNALSKAIVLFIMGDMNGYRTLLEEIRAMVSGYEESDDEHLRKEAMVTNALLHIFAAADELFTFNMKDSANHLITAKNTLSLHKVNFFADLAEKFYVVYSLWTNQRQLTSQNYEEIKNSISSYDSMRFAGFPEILTATFLLSRDLFTEALELVDIAEKLFKVTQSQIGAAFCLYVRSLVALRQLDIRLCLSYATQTLKLSVNKNYFLVGASLLLASICAKHAKIDDKSIIYYQNAVKLYERSCKGFIHVESASLVMHILEHGVDQSFFEAADRYFDKPSSRYNALISVSSIAFVMAAIAKNMPRVLRYYSEVVKTTLGGYDFFLLNQVLPNGLQKVIDFIDESGSTDISVVAMRAGIIKMQEREAIISLNPIMVTELNFDEFDASLDDLDKMLA
ncbi:MAG: protein kinase [Bradymonadales bacterium]|jgi:serine/threonine protein kinase